MVGEVLGLFAAASEDERIAALEADDDFSLARFAHQQFVDFILARVVLADGLAHVDALGGAACQGDDFLLDEAVVDDHVAGLNEFGGLDE